MATIEERLQTARLRLQQKQPRTAVRLLRTVLREDPNQVDAMRLLARIALGHNRHQMARELLERAAELRPRDATLRMNLGVAYQGLGMPNEAIAEYRLALRVRPLDANTHFHMGNAFYSQRRLNEAGHCFQRAIKCQPNFVQAHVNLANALSEAGCINAAALQYQKVLELEPRRDDIYVDLGNVLNRCNDSENAEKCFRAALAINPNSFGALNNLSNLVLDQGKLAEAKDLIMKAARLAPNNAVVQNGAGLVLEKEGNFDEAIARYRKAIELKPNYANPHYNLGGVQTLMGDLEGAEAGYQRAIEYDPQKSEAHYRLACVWLLQGQFEKAWPKYELRWKMTEARGTERTFEQPAWDGGPLNGKTILLYTEQGIGDTLQFVRYAKLIKAMGATVLLECPQRLAPILSRCEGIDQIVAKDQADYPAFDVQAALLSLPGLTGTTASSIPADVPYLTADPEKVAAWGDRLKSVPGLRVGIAWQGKKTFIRDSTRSIDLAHFAALGEIKGVQLISLQKGFGAEQLRKAGTDLKILDLAPELDNGPGAFEDTAAVISHLDLVITSDTSMAHLAGGLGAPVWVALSYVPEWRWLLERSDSPWYPTMRLFRQPAFRDWASTFATIADELRARADSQLVEQTAEPSRA